MKKFNSQFNSYWHAMVFAAALGGVSYFDGTNGLAQATGFADFARLDCKALFPDSVLNTLIPAANSKDVGQAFRGESWPQERLDQLYSCREAGPIPDGFHDGAVIFPSEGGHKKFLELLEKIGLKLTAKDVDQIAMNLWKGKEFDNSGLRTAGGYGAMLRNRVARMLLFPAKVYHGLSVLDVRKDSIIIDYAFSDDFKDYKPFPDSIATREGLLIRDEIRQIRPGLYLGRAYLDGVFGLNFVLSKK